MTFKIGTLVLGNDDGPNPGPKNAQWHRINVVEVKQVPGKEKKFITVRTSDVTLYECDLTVRSITDDRYHELKNLCEQGGPFEVVCNHGNLNMYIVDWTITHDENDKESPLKEESTGDDLNVATWQIRLQEAFDGVSQ